MLCELLHKILFSLPEWLNMLTGAQWETGDAGSGVRYCLPMCVMWLLAPAANLTAEGRQLFPHSGWWLPAPSTARAWCMLYKTCIGAGVPVSAMHQGTPEALGWTPAIPEHATLKEYCIYTAPS